MRTIKNIVISSNGKRRTVRALLDTGATANYLSPAIAGEFPHHLALEKPLRVALGGRQRMLTEQVSINVHIGRHQMPWQAFYMTDLKSVDAILGALFMEQWGVVLDPRRKQIKIKSDWMHLHEEF